MTKVDKKGLARRVKARRAKLGLSGSQLGEAAGMSQQGVDNIEQGKVGRPRNILELASALLTTPQWLLHEIGPEEDKPQSSREQLIEAVEKLDVKMIGAALEYLKRLAEKASEAA